MTVSPGARRSELVGRHGDGWRARIAAPPERGRANDAPFERLAGLLEKPALLRVVAGRRARTKVIEVDGLDANEIEGRLGREVTS